MRRYIFLLNAAIFGILAPLHGTSVHRLGFEELVAKAQTIVQGSVLSAQTYRSADGNLILTNYTISVKERLKGSPGKTITLTTVGGRIGKVFGRSESGARHECQLWLSASRIGHQPIRVRSLL